MATKPIRGIHVFWWIATFFAVVIAADAFFIFRAVGTFPGEQVKNSYVLGLDYNHQLERREAQTKLGWTAEAGLVGDRDPILMVRLKSLSGPVTGLKVDVDMILPGRGAKTLALAERAPGEYVVAIAMDGARRAELEISATEPNGDTPLFEATKILQVAS
jgi:nitrogen fixation protein FixH